MDWTAATHNFGIGLPVSTKNGGAWAYMAPLLADAERIRPSQQQMLTATRMFQVGGFGACGTGTTLPCDTCVTLRLRLEGAWAGEAWAQSVPSKKQRGSTKPVCRDAHMQLPGGRVRSGRGAGVGTTGSALRIGVLCGTGSLGGGGEARAVRHRYGAVQDTQEGAAAAWWCGGVVHHNTMTVLAT